MIRAVFFDFGNTLATNRPSLEDFLSEYIMRTGGAVASESIDQVLRAGKARQLAERPAADEDRWKEFWLDLYQKILVSCGATLTQAAEISEAMWVDHLAPDSYRLFPDVIPSLEILRRRGLIVGVLSNFDASLLSKLRHLKLTALLDYVFFSTAIRAAKPDPRAFLYVCEKVGLTANELLYIGDEIEFDYQPCQLLGIHSLLIDRHDTSPPGVSMIKTLLEIEQILVTL